MDRYKFIIVLLILLSSCNKEYNTIGLNYIICSDLLLNFIDNDIDNIIFYQDPKAKLIPPHEIKEKDLYIEKFNTSEFLTGTLISVDGLGAIFGAILISTLILARPVIVFFCLVVLLLTLLLFVSFTPNIIFDSCAL